MIIDPEFFNQIQSHSQSQPQDIQAPPPRTQDQPLTNPNQNQEQSNPNPINSSTQESQNINANIEQNFINNNLNVINIIDNDNGSKINSITNSNNKDNSKINEKKPNQLENRFSFWYRISEDIVQYQGPKSTLDKKIYETQVKKIHEFGTVEDFWGIFQHLRKPDSCKPGIEFMMFKEPIKPMWEDENNKNGGKISIKLRKDFTTIIWEEMIFTLIGGILPKEMKDEINGIIVTTKRDFNTLQIWFKTYDEKITHDLEQCIRDILVIPPEVNLDVKQFNKDNNERKSSSYYNKNKYNNYYDEGYDNYKEEKNQYKQHKKNKYHNNFFNKNK